jgi:hypothetical protein
VRLFAAPRSSRCCSTPADVSRRFLATSRSLVRSIRAPRPTRYGRSQLNSSTIDCTARITIKLRDPAYKTRPRGARCSRRNSAKL